MGSPKKNRCRVGCDLDNGDVTLLAGQLTKSFSTKLAISARDSQRAGTRPAAAGTERAPVTEPAAAVETWQDSPTLRRGSSARGARR